MPIYEYLCQGCRRRFSALVGVVAGATQVSCPRCGGRKLTKLMSRFSSFRAESDLDDLGGLDDVGEDPRAMRQWARKMGREFGDDLGDELEDEVESGRERDLDEDEAADEEEL